MEVNNRWKLVRFPFARCNLLRPWLLCPLPFGVAGEIVGILHDSMQESPQIREITSSC